jgi:hypothetical protein
MATIKKNQDGVAAAGVSPDVSNLPISPGSPDPAAANAAPEDRAEALKRYLGIGNPSPSAPADTPPEAEDPGQGGWLKMPPRRCTVSTPSAARAAPNPPREVESPSRGGWLKMPPRRFRSASASASAGGGSPSAPEPGPDSPEFPARLVAHIAAHEQLARERMEAVRAARILQQLAQQGQTPLHD